MQKLKMKTDELKRKPKSNHLLRALLKQLMLRDYNNNSRTKKWKYA